MPRAELERLAQERLEQLRAKSEVKQETRSVIKREAGEVYDLTQDTMSPRPKKLSRLASRTKAEVIDLTDD
ncbi:hypothetical protein MGN70_006717 [Eutypa lata]|nr:hypothetical protein MGN70_006717 [Eutypa lata]